MLGLVVTAVGEPAPAALRASAFAAADALAAAAACLSRTANPGMVKYVDDELLDCGVCKMVPTDGFSALIISPWPT